MNRRALSVAAAVLAVCSLASCKKKPTDPDAEPSPSFAHTKTVQWVAASTVPACASLSVAHAWAWTITIKENGGAGGMTVDHVDWSLNGAAQPRQIVAAALTANGTVTINRVVCHGDGPQKTVVETVTVSYKGQQSTSQETVTLLARPQ
jgi:hypothetical protein